MTSVDIITELFCKVDDVMKDIPNHSQEALHPSELVTIGVLYAFKGVGHRAFYRWISTNHTDMFPSLPERTRLFRRLNKHRDWTQRFLADPSLLGVADTYGIELIHPAREGRTAKQIGRKGKSNHRWIVGGKLCLVLNHLGLVVDWDCSTANRHDNHFIHLIERLVGRMVVLTDMGFHTAEADPPNLKLCRRGEWNVRMKVETVLSMLTVVCHMKKMRHRVWEYFRTRLAYLMIAFNILVGWDGLVPDEHGVVRLSIARFTL